MGGERVRKEGKNKRGGRSRAEEGQIHNFVAWKIFTAARKADGRCAAVHGFGQSTPRRIRARTPRTRAATVYGKFADGSRNR